MIQELLDKAKEIRTALEVNADAQSIAQLYFQFRNTDPKIFKDIENPGQLSAAIYEFQSLENLIKEEVHEENEDGPRIIALRNLYRAVDFAQEILGEAYFGFQVQESEENVKTSFSSFFPETLVNPKFLQEFKGPEDIQEGDILLFRGNSVSSPAIARIGVAPSIYSHAGIIAKDTSGQLQVVESIVQKGILTRSLEDALNENTPRMLVLRHKNPDFALKAAEKAWGKYAETLNGTAVEYRFSMILDPSREDFGQLFFCSEFVYWAYLEAAVELEADFNTDKILSPLRASTQNFRGKIGIEADITLAPGDFVFQEDLEILAESKDYGLTHRARVLDLTLDALYTWLDPLQGDRAYAFDPDLFLNEINFVLDPEVRAESVNQDLLELVQPALPQVPGFLQKQGDLIRSYFLLVLTTEYIYSLTAEDLDPLASVQEIERRLQMIRQSTVFSPNAFERREGFAFFRPESEWAFIGYRNDILAAFNYLSGNQDPNRPGYGNILKYADELQFYKEKISAGELRF